MYFVTVICKCLYWNTCIPNVCLKPHFSFVCLEALYCVWKPYSECVKRILCEIKKKQNFQLYQIFKRSVNVFELMRNQKLTNCTGEELRGRFLKIMSLETLSVCLKTLYSKCVFSKPCILIVCLETLHSKCMCLKSL